MKTFLGCVAVLACALAMPAAASERYLGKIASAAGGDTTNATTAAPFVVPFGVKLTVWCDAAAFVAVDTATASSATSGALPVALQEKFPTSTGSQGSTAAVVTIGSFQSAVIRISGPAVVNCYVSARQGTE